MQSADHGRWSLLILWETAKTEKMGSLFMVESHYTKNVVPFHLKQRYLKERKKALKQRFFFKG